MLPWRLQFSDRIQIESIIVTRSSRSVENFVENLIYRNSSKLLSSSRDLASTQSTLYCFVQPTGNDMALL